LKLEGFVYSIFRIDISQAHL